MSQPQPTPWASLSPQQTAPPSTPPPLVLQHRTAPLVQPAQLPPPQPAPGLSITQRSHPPITMYSGFPMPTSPGVNNLLPGFPPNFDPSRPPPPIPPHVQCGNKRKLDANHNAGTNKQKKPEGSESSDSPCQNCIQRQQKIDDIKHQMEQLHIKEEEQILLYEITSQEYEINKQFLKDLVGPDVQNIIVNQIENTEPPLLDTPGPSVPSTSRIERNVQSTSSLPTRQPFAGARIPQADLVSFVLETLKNHTAPERSPSVEIVPNETTDADRVNNGTNGYDPRPNTSGASGHTVTCVQGQAYLSRRDQAMPSYAAAGPSGYPPAAAPPPAAFPMYHPAIPPPPNLHYYPQYPLADTAPERSPSVEIVPNETTDADRVNNGTNRYDPRPNTSGASGHTVTCVQGQEYLARRDQAMPSYVAAGPSGYPPAAAPPPAAFPMYHSAIPPPRNLHYYPQHPLAGAANVPHNGTERTLGPVPVPGMQPPATPCALRPNTPNYNYMSRYPQPPYYPPYQ